MGPFWYFVRHQSKAANHCFWKLYSAELSKIIRSSTYQSYTRHDLYQSTWQCTSRYRQLSEETLNCTQNSVNDRIKGDAAPKTSKSLGSLDGKDNDDHGEESNLHDDVFWIERCELLKRLLLSESNRLRCWLLLFCGFYSQLSISLTTCWYSRWCVYRCMSGLHLLLFDSKNELLSNVWSDLQHQDKR